MLVVDKSVGGCPPKPKQRGGVDKVEDRGQRHRRVYPSCRTRRAPVSVRCGWFGFGCSNEGCSLAGDGCCLCCVSGRRAGVEHRMRRARRVNGVGTSMCGLVSMAEHPLRGANRADQVCAPRTLLGEAARRFPVVGVAGARVHRHRTRAVPVFTGSGVTGIAGLLGNVEVLALAPHGAGAVLRVVVAAIRRTPPWGSTNSRPRLGVVVIIEWHRFFPCMLMAADHAPIASFLRWPHSP